MHLCISCLLAVIWLLVLPVCPRAEVVGRFSMVEGPVDLLKQGKVPASPAKVEDAVEPGDVVRTKSQGRAQVKFVDDSLLTIAPGSRVAIEAYMYDAGKGTRKAVLQVFRGMVQTVVTRILKTQEADFIMKTHTAVIGVRGTKWYTLLGPSATDVYNEEGKVCIHNFLAEIGGEVCLNPMEFSRVMADLAPTSPAPFKKEDLAPLEKMLHTGGASPPPPTGVLGVTQPLAFLDRLRISDLKLGTGDRLSFDRQSILSRDFLLERVDRDRDRPQRPGFIDLPSPGTSPGFSRPGGGILGGNNRPGSPISGPGGSITTPGGTGS
ncbi:MAG: hypothetical protein C4567_15385 [Deltaproteobacteria bacterium]|nr:MAG: hypothetical protein C4567_15385 [Deltaproteobacteria bacterium]